jgi:hypothetical protein
LPVATVSGPFEDNPRPELAGLAGDDDQVFHEGAKYPPVFPFLLLVPSAAAVGAKDWRTPRAWD